MTPPDRTLFDIREDILQARAWIVSGIVLGCLSGLVFIYLAVPKYEARMIVSPATPMTEVSAAAVSSHDNFSGLRDLLQKGVFSGSADFLRFENIVTGPSVAAKLLQDEKIQKGLALDKTFRFSKKQTQWTPEQLADYLEQNVELQPVGSTALRRIVYQHPNREFAIYLLHAVQDVADLLIRSKVREEAQIRVDYLQQESTKTINPDHRRALTSLLLDEERLLMLASIDQPYAANIIEPPVASRQTVWPDAMLIMPILMFLGTLAGFLLHGLLKAHRKTQFTIEEKGWFRSEGSNTNEPRRSLGRRHTDAAE